MVACVTITVFFYYYLLNSIDDDRLLEPTSDFDLGIFGCTLELQNSSSVPFVIYILLNLVLVTIASIIIDFMYTVHYLLLTCPTGSWKDPTFKQAFADRFVGVVKPVIKCLNRGKITVVVRVV